VVFFLLESLKISGATFFGLMPTLIHKSFIHMDLLVMSYFMNYSYLRSSSFYVLHFYVLVISYKILLFSKFSFIMQNIYFSLSGIIFFSEFGMMMTKKKNLMWTLHRQKWVALCGFTVFREGNKRRSGSKVHALVS
jgi:hypothetical protein